MYRPLLGYAEDSWIHGRFARFGRRHMPSGFLSGGKESKATIKADCAPIIRRQYSEVSEDRSSISLPPNVLQERAAPLLEVPELPPPKIRILCHPSSNLCIVRRFTAVSIAWTEYDGFKFKATAAASTMDVQAFFLQVPQCVPANLSTDLARLPPPLLHAASHSTTILPSLHLIPCYGLSRAQISYSTLPTTLYSSGLVTILLRFVDFP
ncbi:hypothetical protein FB45DRAFT_42609 [Roridomyces roridus]|uniref:Uncharacterized protein n=1 Tax=Roridomyces roridus TaxID=1738132 RepID=A0AAD7BRN0_9AGAR|nr:hypothetical protein FB45DRAFT_42609 [Roridomyces roridus]